MDEHKRVIFDVNHPAQVHLFRHAITELEDRGHDTLVTSREKEITTDLLDAYGIDHELLSTAGDGAVSLVTELLGREWRLLSVAREFEPDVIVSRLSPAAAHVSTVLGCPNVVFTDTVVPSKLMRTLNYGMTLPFVDVACIPPNFELPFSPARTVTAGFHELAYLHPNRFEPDAERLAAAGVAVDEPYFVLRFASWDAYHDVGNEGWSRQGKRDIVSFLDDHGTVYITSESELPSEFREYQLSVPPHLIHDLLYFSDLYLGDSQTMCTEATLLGTPSIRVNSKVGTHDMNNFVELDRRGLLFSYPDERDALAQTRAIVTGQVDADWERKRQALIDDKRDVTSLMLELILRSDAAPETEAPVDSPRSRAAND
ncbi:DUF354 domain-containing protein [Halorientalis brevis]|uniref:DUF354 domain-containing protein n=1 Tax=Halorientalis brevis TaxID=1126241 RepID=A0ABD6CEW6_9EURY|nr:DUF354 domain-containing protein [Halorientalis brevis]